VDLLPDRYFSNMIDRCANRNDHLFEGYARTLFTAMRTGGHVGFDKIEWFNGGLFDTDDALPLTYQDIDDLKRAAYLDWSEIDSLVLLHRSRILYFVKLSNCIKRCVAFETKAAAA
jgi:hypothetical protein